MENLKWMPQLIQGMLMDCEDLLDKSGNLRVTVSSKIEKVIIDKPDLKE